MTESEIPEPDRAPGAPHPRETEHVYGQADAEMDFLRAFNSGRMHHGWLLTGPKGVGKATLAWRIARFLLTQPLAEPGGMFDDPPPGADSLDVLPDHPVARRLRALAEPRLFLLRPGWDEKKNRLKQGITVDETRGLRGFFQLSAADGGRRVVIVDAADEMNANAANALLKQLEEPPANAVLLLVAHRPSRLLPTIRSRCRELRCKPLGPADMAQALAETGIDDRGDAALLSALAAGSVGQAIRLAELDGAALYQNLVSALSGVPRIDRPSAIALADTVAARSQAEKFDLLLDLIDLLISRIARAGVLPSGTGALVNGEADLLQRLCPSPAAARKWAELQQQLSDRTRSGRAVNLDPSTLILDTLLRINDAASQVAA